MRSGTYNQPLARYQKPTTMNKTSFHLIFAFVFAQSMLLGQKQPLLFHHLTTESGLSESSNAYIKRDKSGFVWISSIEGLNRYDGINIKVYQADPTNPKAIKGNLILSGIFEDANRNLWFATDKGLNRYERKQDAFTKITLLGDPNILDQPNLVCLDGDGYLWIDRGPNGLIRINTNADPTLPPEQWQESVGTLSAQKYFPVLDESNQKLICIYTSHPDSIGLMKYTYENGKVLLTERLFNEKNNTPTLTPKSVLSTENGNTLWISHEQGILQYKVNDKSYTSFAMVQKIPLEGITQITELAPNQLALATEQRGLLIWDLNTNSIQQYEHKESMPLSIATNRVRNIYFDREHKIIWLSSWGSGVDYASLNKTKFNTIRLPDISANEDKPIFVPAVLAYSNEGVWCASWQNKGLRHLDNKGDLIRDYSNITGRVDDILASSRFGTFFCSANGVFEKINNSPSLKLLNNCEENETAYLTNIFEARDKSIIGSLPDGGLAEITSINGRHCVRPLKVAESDTLSLGRMFEDANGRGFAEEMAGNIIIFEGTIKSGKMLRRIKVSGLINSFCENSNHVWIGGSFGLMRIDKTTLKDTIVDIYKNSPEQSVQSVLAAGDEELWISSTRGLFRYNLVSQRLDAFELYDGLQSNEFNIASGMKSPDGRLWFGGIRGLNVIDPKNITLVSTVPTIQITDILVHDLPHDFEQNVSELSYFSLSNGNSTLTFKFAAIEFSDAKNNQLWYQMFKDGAPFDTAKVFCPNAFGLARYAQLPPGSYRFVIEAESSDGVRSEIPKEIKFVIRPPFYLTWEFALFLSLIVAAVLRGLYKRAIEQERMKSKLASSKFEVLRSALKAHFIRNMAADLQGLMSTNVDKAQAYLYRFTELMTNILDSVSNAYVRIEDELELVRNYLKLSALSFPEGNLKFDVTPLDDLEAAGLEIPGMLLQPFVENAVKHGLKSKNGEGEIRVSISMEKNCVLCIIQDDGVGRKPKAANDTHRSRSIEINEERLRIYDKEQGGTSKIEIFDPKTDAGESSGTRVEIRIGLPQEKSMVKKLWNLVK